MPSLCCSCRWRLEAIKSEIGLNSRPPSKPPIAPPINPLRSLAGEALKKPFSDADPGAHHHPANRPEIGAENAHQNVSEKATESAADSSCKQSRDNSFQLLGEPHVGHAGEQVQAHPDRRPDKRRPGPR